MYIYIQIEYYKWVNDCVQPITFIGIYVLIIYKQITSNHTYIKTRQVEYENWIITSHQSLCHKTIYIIWKQGNTAFYNDLNENFNSTESHQYFVKNRLCNKFYDFWLSIVQKF